MEAFYGQWEIDHSRTTNSNAFFKASGFNDEMAKEFTDRKWRITYSPSTNGKIRLRVEITNRPNLTPKLYEVTLDEEWDYVGIDGDTSVCKMSLDGNKLTEVHKYKHTPSEGAGGVVEVIFNIVKEIKGDELHLLSSMNGVDFIQVYKKLC